jgi:hypothetical protein
MVTALTIGRILITSFSRNIILNQQIKEQVANNIQNDVSAFKGPEKSFALAYDDILAMYQLYSKLYHFYLINLTIQSEHYV